MDWNIRDLQRQAASGDPRAQIALLRAQLRAGQIEVKRVRLAASLGHPIAKKLGLPPYTSPATLSRAWYRLNFQPYIKRAVHIINAISCELNDYANIVVDPVLQHLSDSLHHWANNQMSNRELALHFCRIGPEYSGFYQDLAAMALYHGVREVGHIVGDECGTRINETAMNANTFESLVEELVRASSRHLEEPLPHFKNRYTIMLLNHAVLPEYPLPVPPIVPEARRNPEWRDNPDQFDLIKKVLDQVAEWRLSPYSRNGYVYGEEGEIYLRKVIWPFEYEINDIAIKESSSQLHLVNIMIYDDYRDQGLMKQLLIALVESDLDVIKIELIHNAAWYLKVKNYKFPHRITAITHEGAPSVYFIREDAILNSEARRNPDTRLRELQCRFQVLGALEDLCR